MKVTRYDLNKGAGLTFAVMTDLHDAPTERIFEKLSALSCDAILIAGDFVHKKSLKNSPNALKLLRACPKIAPTFISFGNHERNLVADDERLIRETGVTVLDDSHVLFKGIYIGGFTSFYMEDSAVKLGDESAGKTKYRLFKRMKMPSKSCGLTEYEERTFKWLGDFEKLDGVKILMCHHPEYYPAYLKGKNFGVIVSGHAHGGQIRLFGHGFFAPDQGFFPKYTRGVYDENLVVSAGLAHTGGIVPRLFNPTELVVLKI